jgi:hypothetical protein
MVRSLLPFTVPPKTTPELVLDTLTAAPSVTGLLNVIAPAAVLVTLPSSVMTLVPLAV